MIFNSKDFENAVEDFKCFSQKKHLPMWDELPDLELYMDQVIVLVNQYLNIFSNPKTDEKVITPSMINNYVKMKIIPMPVKKRYSRLHLACLIMVCALKQSLNISTIEKMLPTSENAKSAAVIYNSFACSWEKSFGAAAQQINEYASAVAQSNDYARINELVMQIAISSNVFKIFTEKVIAIHYINEKIEEKTTKPEKVKSKQKKKQDEPEKEENSLPEQI